MSAGSHLLPRNIFARAFLILALLFVVFTLNKLCALFMSAGIRQISLYTSCLALLGRSHIAPSKERRAAEVELVVVETFNRKRL